MKTLYISDMDGTLLNRDAELSDYTVAALNHLIAEGMHFSVATARSAATAIPILERVNLNMPVALMNGVLVYDITARRFIKKEMLDGERVTNILEAMRKSGQTGMMYTLTEDSQITYYEPHCSEALQDFMEERVRKYNKTFIQLDDLGTISTDIIYFCFLDIKENIEHLHEDIKHISGLHIEKYQDNYYVGDLWYLEVFSDTASKYNAVRFLRQRYGFDKVVGFGDNLNDLPLLKACDEGYAVDNAVPELKAVATAVIGAHYEDGVVKQLLFDVCR